MTAEELQRETAEELQRERAEMIQRSIADATRDIRQTGLTPTVQDVRDRLMRKGIAIHPMQILQHMLNAGA